MQRSFNYGCDRQSELKALRANKTLISNQYSERQLKEVHYEHTVPMPKGRVFPFPFGMFLRKLGWGR
jgi:hypothetical protein